MPEESVAIVRSYSCPECRETYETPELLAVHLERHREVFPPKFNTNKKSATRPCVKGCGRNFGKLQRPDHRHHEKLCDGQAPLPIRPPVDLEAREGLPNYMGQIPDSPWNNEEMGGDEPESPARRKKPAEPRADLKCGSCGVQYERGGTYFEKHVARCKVGRSGKLLRGGAALRLGRLLREAAAIANDLAGAWKWRSKRLLAIADELDRMAGT